MEVPHHVPDEKTTVTVLVTGANSGLGLATCCRLIDEFLSTRPQSQTLHLLFSTRDAKKSEETLKRLNAHLQKTLQQANARTVGIGLLLEPRIKLEGVLVDLTKLLTVKSLAKQLLVRGQHLDAVVCNAGIAGWKGLNYPQAIWDICTGIIQATTYPKFMICDVGLLTSRQTGGYGQVHMFAEPRLGQVFTANVFGHYMLTHWLAPLMDENSRIIWISSTSAIPEVFSLEDIQGIQSSVAYESSKRLTDFLVLTSELPSTEAYVKRFLPTAGDESSPNAATDRRPKMYLTHPGIIGTAISGVPWLIALFMFAALHLARYFASPWHPVDPYKGAVSVVFAVLAPREQFCDFEDREGKGKWGSACDVYGAERVARTAVEGWGYCGKVGVMPSGSVPDRRRGRKVTDKESREQFEEDGRKVWREMEELRVEWEKRLGKVNSGSSVDV